MEMARRVAWCGYPVEYVLEVLHDGAARNHVSTTYCLLSDPSAK